MSIEVGMARQRRGLGGRAHAAAAALCALALLATLGTVPAAAAGEPAAGPGLVRDAVGDARWDADAAVPGALIVTTRPEPAAQRPGARGAGLLAAAGLAAGSASEIAPGVVRLDVAPGGEAEAAAVLAGRPDVASVEPDYFLRLLAQPDDPGYRDQWAHAQTGIAQAWDHTTGSPAVKVAILDSGVDGTHPDLENNVVAQVSTADGTRPSHDGTDGTPKANVDCPSNSRGYSHGTAVAGVLGAEGNNATGVAGVAWRVGIVDVAVTGRKLQTGGSDAQRCEVTTVSAVMAGLQWVLEQHADVAAVNMSFGMVLPECPTGIQNRIDALRDRDVTVVAAAGNDGGFERIMPAGCDGVIAVGATRGDRQLASYSSRQRYVDLVAPGGGSGEGVLTTVRGSVNDCQDYCPMAGTSFAAPYVAGVVALAQDLRAGMGRARLRPTQIESLLEITARHPGGPGVHDERFGWGRLHAGDAIRHVAQRRGIPSLREHPLIRWSRGDGSTEPVRQAIAISEGLFDRRSARHVLVARSDDYADALAGSPLGFGVGPILFTPPGQALFSPVRREIDRVLPPGGRVYLLGGTAAVDERVERELRQLGYQVVRLSGPTREWTAAEIAAEVVERVDELGHPVNSGVVVATRENWPDAVAAGSFAALYGLPTLLTPVNSLHPATQRALEALDLRQVYVVGGTAAVSTPTAQAIAGVTRLQPLRLSGATRIETAVAVGREIERELGFSDRWPTFGIAVNLDRHDGYAHTLAASAAAAMTGSVFVPLNWTSQRGTYINDSAHAYACGLGVDALLPGDVDLLPAAVARALQDLYDRPLSAC